MLCLQDGTDLNFAEHEGCRGLGLIRKNQSGSGTLGLHMHSTLVVDGEGVPLGVPQIQYEAPEAGGPKRKPAGERKTRHWVEGLRECARLASELEGVRPVSVMDREGDSFELFVEQRRLGTVDLLVRAQHNRRLGRQLPKLFERVRAAQAQAGMEIEVGRRSGRRATRQQKAGEGAPGPGRVALAQGGVGAAKEQRLHKGGPGPSEPGPCAGGQCRRGSPAVGVVLVDQCGDEVEPRGEAGAGVVSPALAHRGLAPGAEDGLHRWNTWGTGAGIGSNGR